MSKYIIPIFYQCHQLLEVEADSLEQAKEKVINGEHSFMPNGDYIDQSAEIDQEGLDLELYEQPKKEQN